MWVLCALNLYNSQLQRYEAFIPAFSRSNFSSWCELSHMFHIAKIGFVAQNEPWSDRSLFPVMRTRQSLPFNSPLPCLLHAEEHRLERLPLIVTFRVVGRGWKEDVPYSSRVNSRKSRGVGARLVKLMPTFHHSLIKNCQGLKTRGLTFTLDIWSDQLSYWVRIANQMDGECEGAHLVRKLHLSAQWVIIRGEHSKWMSSRVPWGWVTRITLP